MFKKNPDLSNFGVTGSNHGKQHTYMKNSECGAPAALITSLLGYGTDVLLEHRDGQRECEEMPKVTSYSV